jgi:hypothetical protein
MTGNIDDSADT